MSSREPKQISTCCSAEIAAVIDETNATGKEKIYCTSCNRPCSTRIDYGKEEVLVVQHALLYLKRQVESKIAHTRRMCKEGAYECVCELANANRAYREVITLIDKLLEK